MPRARQRQNDRGIVHELIQTFIAVSLYGLFFGKNKEHHHHYHKSEAPQQTKPYQSRSSGLEAFKRMERSAESERPADWEVAEAEKAALELARQSEESMSPGSNAVTDQSDVGLSGVRNSADDSTET